ncbi:MAG: hypothetical protein R3C02_00940 [Planctomycetaceae bacterium]
MRSSAGGRGLVADMEGCWMCARAPYDPQHPVVCMDEQPKQLIEERRTPLPIRPGRPRGGTTNTSVMAAAACGCSTSRWVAGDVRVSERRTAIDWAHMGARSSVDAPRYRPGEITLVCDQLNTHRLASFDKAFEPGKAPWLAGKLDLMPHPSTAAGSTRPKASLQAC